MHGRSLRPYQRSGSPELGAVRAAMKRPKKRRKKGLRRCYEQCVRDQRVAAAQWHPPSCRAAPAQVHDR